MKIKLFQKLFSCFQDKKDLNRLSQLVPETNFSQFCCVGNNLYKKGFKIKKIDYNKQLVTFTNGQIKFVTDVNYPWIALEIFGDEIYRFHKPIDHLKSYTVLDIGANRGYAALYFAQKSYVKMVYAFELVPQTVEFIKKNCHLNPKYKKKIKAYDFGLGKEKGMITIKRLDNRDGCNTINSDFIESYMPEEKGKGIPQECHIEQASKILKEIIEKNHIQNIILKIDVEGAEYDIMDDLNQNYPDIFDKCVKIIGDTHLGFDRFYNKIKKYGFKITYKKKSKDGCCPFELDK